jgi:hypothetical protein
MRRDEAQKIVLVVLAGRLSRREVIGRLAVFGIWSSAIAFGLAEVVRPAQAATPTKRGGSGGTGVA